MARCQNCGNKHDDCRYGCVYPWIGCRHELWNCEECFTLEQILDNDKRSNGLIDLLDRVLKQKWK